MAARSICRADFCDAVVCVDGTASGFGFNALKKFIPEASTLPVFKARPLAMVLEDDFMSVVVSAMREETSSSIAVSDKSLLQLANFTSVFISHPLHAAANVETADSESDRELPLRVRRDHAPTDTLYESSMRVGAIPEWIDSGNASFSTPDALMVLTALKCLFPSAAVAATTFSADVWLAPALGGTDKFGTVKRVFQLSAAKVMKLKLLDVNRERQRIDLGSIDYDALKKCSDRVLSISGYVKLPTGASLQTSSSDKKQLVGSNSKVVLFEACAEFISIKFAETLDITNLNALVGYAEPGRFNKSCRFIMTGALDTADKKIVDYLFSSCYLSPLTVKQTVFFSDLNVSELEAVQEAHQQVPLPGGWWYDGNSYIDMSGTRKKFRPDLEGLCRDYLIKRNTEIERHNYFVMLGGC